MLSLSPHTHSNTHLVIVAVQIKIIRNDSEKEDVDDEDFISCDTCEFYFFLFTVFNFVDCKQSQ